MGVDAKDFVKGAISKALAFRYHKVCEAKAYKVLRTLEAQLGKTSAAQLKRAHDYAREVLGHTHYSPWLYVYTAASGTFREGWIPDNYYARVVVPKVNGFYGKVSHLKLLERILLQSDVFPDVAYYVNNLFFTPDYTPIRLGDVRKVVFRDCERIAFKVDNSRQGKGIFFFTETDFDIGKILALGNGVFQKYIIQHKTLAEFSPSSVATLRITTAVDDDGVISARACYLRLGRGEDTHVQSRSHIRVPIEVSTGAFAREGYLADWRAVEEHPDTGVKFLGHKVPAFPQCVSTALELHKKVPFARCVGWDIAVAADESVRIMEWNGEHNDIKFSEATQGPCFADLGWEKLWRAQPACHPDRSNVPGEAGTPSS